MLHRKICSMLFITLILSACTIARAKDSRCQHEKSELNCVVTFQSVIYKENPEYFWSVLNRARDNALTCKSINGTSEFLRLVRITNPSTELEEFLSEGIEKLCMEHPICFKKAQSLLDGNIQSKLSNKLLNPLYFDKKTLLCIETR